MQVSHATGQVSAEFDDPNLVSCGGLAPVVALAQRCGLAELVASRFTLSGKGGVNEHLTIPALVAGMVAVADSIEDMDLLRHGGMDRLFTGVHAPSTFGTFLRTFTFGHVRQLDSIVARLLAELVAQTPPRPDRVISSHGTFTFSDNVGERTLSDDPGFACLLRTSRGDLRCLRLPTDQSAKTVFSVSEALPTDSFTTCVARSDPH